MGAARGARLQARERRQLLQLQLPAGGEEQVRQRGQLPQLPRHRPAPRRQIQLHGQHRTCLSVRQSLSIIACYISSWCTL